MACFSSDNRTLASASWDNTVKLWDLEAPEGDSLTVRLTIRCPQRVSSIGFSPNGRLLAVGHFRGIAIYDPATGEEAHPFKETKGPVTGVAFSPAGVRPGTRPRPERRRHRAGGRHYLPNAAPALAIHRS